MLPPQPKFGQKSDWKHLANDIVELGPEKLYFKKVLSVKESDSDLTKFQRFKKHDDASLLEIIFP